MSEHSTTKDQVSLDDLKRAISIVPAEPSKSDSDLLFAHYHCVRADAWRTAFKWHRRLIEGHAALSDTVGATLADWIAFDREEEEGLALIAEKLR